MIFLAAYVLATVWRLFFTATPKEYRPLVFGIRILGLGFVFLLQLVFVMFAAESAIMPILMLASWILAWVGANHLAAGMLAEKGYKPAVGIRTTTL